MKHTEKYLQAKWVTENPNGYDERDVVDAKRYCNAYLEGYNQALRIHDVVGQSEQLPKRLSNEAYKTAKTLRYEEFVEWWDSQV